MGENWTIKIFNSPSITKRRESGGKQKCPVNYTPKTHQLLSKKNAPSISINP